MYFYTIPTLFHGLCGLKSVIAEISEFQNFQMGSPCIYPSYSSAIFAKWFVKFSNTIIRINKETWWIYLHGISCRSIIEAFYNPFRLKSVDKIYIFNLNMNLERLHSLSVWLTKWEEGRWTSTPPSMGTATQQPDMIFYSHLNFYVILI